MLKVDLARLERQRRLQVEAELEPDDPIWAGTGLDLARPLDVRLEAQQVGHDVVVRGRLSGDAALECRRCLKAIEVPIDEEVAVLTDSLTSLMEPLLIIVLGGIVGFIVVALFMPLIALIQKLS